MVEIRQCTRADTSKLRDFTAKRGFTRAYGVDWSEAAPNWLLALKDGAVIGAVQMLFAHPIGRIEYLLLDPDQPHFTKARTARRLMKYAKEAHRDRGIKFVAGTIIKAPLREALLKRGATVSGEGTVILWPTDRM